MYVERNRWQAIKLPEPVDRSVSVQNIDNYQTYNGSVFKRKMGVSESKYAYGVSVLGKLLNQFPVENRLPTAIDGVNGRKITSDLDSRYRFLRLSDEKDVIRETLRTPFK